MAVRLQQQLTSCAEQHTHSLCERVRERARAGEPESESPSCCLLFGSARNHDKSCWPQVAVVVVIAAAVGRAITIMPTARPTERRRQTRTATTTTVAAQTSAISIIQKATTTQNESTNCKINKRRNFRLTCSQLQL